MFFHPHLKGDLTDTASDYVLVLLTLAKTMQPDMDAIRRVSSTQETICWLAWRAKQSRGIVTVTGCQIRLP
jgi:hypothetical protein